MKNTHRLLNVKILHLEHKAKDLYTFKVHSYGDIVIGLVINILDFRWLSSILCPNNFNNILVVKLMCSI